MLKGISLQDLAKKIETKAAGKQDFIVPTEQATLQVENKGVVMEIPQGRFPIMNTAHDQIGARAGIPAKYYDRMLKEAPDLLATNVNAWHRINPERRMTRMLNGNMRAFLSDRYQRIEDEQIAKAALPELLNLPKVQIVSSEITDKRMYIHFVVPTLEGEVKVGDVVQAGGILSNSEIGWGAASIAGLLWRLRCLNGMKTAETFRRNHVGRRAEEDGELDWADDTRQADDKAILLKVRDMVRAVVDETRFKANLIKLKGLTEGKITGDPARAVEMLAQKIGATETEGGGILRALIEGGDLSRWGIVNAVTAQGHTATSYDRAVEFEAAGGALVDLPNTEWKRILEAA